MSTDQIIIPGDGIDDLGRSIAPFAIGKRLTVFEWCMVYTARNPAVLTAMGFDYKEPIIRAMDQRLLHIGAVENHEGRRLGNILGTTRNPADLSSGPDEFLRDTAPHVLRGPLLPRPLPIEPPDHVARQVGIVFRPDLPVHPYTDDPAWTSNEVYRELVGMIKAGEIDPQLVMAHLRDRPETTDYTLCVIDRLPVLKIAQRRLDYGWPIGKLLSTSDQPGGRETPSAALQQSESLADWIFSQHSRSKTSEQLYDEGRRSLNRTFTKTAFLAAYREVYETAPHRPCATGWPLRSPYKERHESDLSRETLKT